jgi:hypothetical protein
MKKLFAITAAVLVSTSALAGPTCTDGNKDNWIPEDTFQKNLVEQGYKIKKFKTTSGGCYEIYGHNAEGQKVEIYFNPVNGDIVKQEID